MTPNKLRVSAGLCPIGNPAGGIMGRAVLAGNEVIAVFWPTGADRGLDPEACAAERDEHANAMVDAFHHVFRRDGR